MSRLNPWNPSNQPSKSFNNNQSHMSVAVGWGRKYIFIIFFLLFKPPHSHSNLLGIWISNVHLPFGLVVGEMTFWPQWEHSSLVIFSNSSNVLSNLIQLEQQQSLIKVFKAGTEHLNNRETFICLLWWHKENLFAYFSGHSVN